MEPRDVAHMQMGSRVEVNGAATQDVQTDLADDAGAIDDVAGAADRSSEQIQGFAANHGRQEQIIQVVMNLVPYRPT
jgi:hypothetical protein